MKTKTYEICATTNAWLAQRKSLFINLVKEYNKDNTMVTVVLEDDMDYEQAVEWIKNSALESVDYMFELSELVDNGIVVNDFTSFEEDSVIFSIRPAKEIM